MIVLFNCFSVDFLASPAAFPPFFAISSLFLKESGFSSSESSVVTLSPSIVKINSKSFIWSLRLAFDCFGKFLCCLYSEGVIPNESALNSAERFLRFENKIGESFVETLVSFRPNKKYDTVFTSHTNYYWAKDEQEYRKQLDKVASLIDKGGRLMILTLPKESDHYNIMLHQVYPAFNYSGYISNYYKSKGFKVKIIRFKMRMFVGDMLTNGKFYEVNNFYKFIHNINETPSKKESKEFLEKLKKYQKNGYLDFKDELIIVSG